MTLNALSIASRIYAGFAIVLALLCALALFAYASLSTVGDEFTEYRATARQSLFMGQADEALAETRLSRLGFQTAPDAARAQEVRDNLSTLDGFIAKAPETFSGEGDASIRQGFAEAAAIVGQYRATFDAEVEAEARRDALVERYQEIGGRVTAEAEEIARMFREAADYEGAFLAADFSRQLLRARVWRTHFMLSGDESANAKAVERAAYYLEAFEKLKSRMNSPVLAQKAATLEALMAQFVSVIAELTETIAAAEAAEKALVAEIGPKLGEAFDEVSNAVETRQNTLGPVAAANIEKTRTTATVIAAGALALGLALAFLIGRWIARAVAGMAEAMGRMAGGDLEAEVTGDAYDHELGRMAKALKVFRDNGREMRRLDAEKQAQVAREAAAAKERAALQGAVQDVVEKASAGDFRPRVEARFADDGLNAFARLMNSLLETVAQGVSETARVMAALARGDLSARMEGAYRGAFAELKDNVNATVERLSGTVRDIKTASVAIRTATGEIASGADNLSGRAENQAASLEEVAATMEQMSATVKTNAENAASASSLAADASSRADQGGAIVAKAVTAMAKIEEGSGKIADIVSVIDGFAFQTNLLALNAAVEAARAGEAGKGFAVVASEVRTLAQRSAEAARDIKALIQDSSVQVADGVKLVEDTGAALRAIVEAIRKVSETIVDISEASREQSSGVDEITSAITSMDEITQQNSALADESASAARGLADQAAKLEQLMGFFTVTGRDAAEAPRMAARAA